MAILGSATYKLDTDQSRFNRGLAKAEQTSRESSKRIGRNFAKMGAGILAVGAGMSFAFLKVGKGALELERQFAEVRTLLPKVGDKAFGALQKDVISLANELGMAAQDVVPALYQAISAGVPTENVISFLRTSGKAAIGGVTDLTTAVDGISSVVNAYADSSFTAANASDLMFTTVRLGKTTFKELSRSLFNAVPVAASLGIGFDQITASLAAMTSQGVPTKIATTGLRQLFIEMSKDGMELADVIQNRYGKSLSGLMGEGRDFTKIMNEIAASMPSDEFRNMFSSVEAMAAAMLLVGPGGDLVADALAEMRASAGATDEAFQIMADTAGFKLSRAWNTVKNTVKIAFVTLLPQLSDLMTRVQGVVAAFSEWAERNPKLMQALLIGTAVVTGLAVAIGGLLLVVAGAMMAFGALGVAGLITVGWIGLAALAVIALVAAGVWLVKNWDKVKKSLVAVFDTVLAWVRPVVDTFALWAENNPKLMRALVVARQAVGGLTMALDWLLQKATAAWEAIKTFAEEQWERLKDIWEKHLKPIWEKFKEVWETSIKPAVLWLLEKFEALPGAIQIAFLGAAAYLAATMLALLTVWTARMLVHLAVWMATSLARMAVWAAAMLVRFAVFLVTSLARMALWPAAMLTRFAVWTVTSLARMAVWTAAMLVRFAAWTAAMLANMAWWVAGMLLRFSAWTTAMLTRFAVWAATSLARMAVWTARMLVMFSAWAARMFVIWLVALGPIGLIIAAVAVLGGAAFLLMANWESIDGRWRTLWDGLKVKAVGVLNDIIEKLNEVIRLWNAIPAVPSVGEIGKVDPDSIGTPSLEDALNTVGQGFPGLQFIKPGTLLKKGAGWLGGTGGDKADGEIPEFARGGIVTGPTLARIGEAGPEAVVPLNGKGGLGGGLTIIFQGDVYGGEDFGDRVRDAVDEATRRGVVFGAA